jgi:hypothetical protein
MVSLCKRWWLGAFLNTKRQLSLEIHPFELREKKKKEKRKKKRRRLWEVTHTGNICLLTDLKLLYIYIYIFFFGFFTLSFFLLSFLRNGGILGVIKKIWKKKIQKLMSTITSAEWDGYLEICFRMPFVDRIWRLGINKPV